MPDPIRHHGIVLETFATGLLTSAGMEADKAAVVARYLVRADAMGHSTHGLGLLPGYLDALDDGTMVGNGEPAEVSDRGAAVAWRGKRLPGAWLTSKAVALACKRARTHGVCTVSIAESHHIGCLAAYLPDATDLGLMVSVASSSPAGASVAPLGGTRPVYTPDPIAYGIPTDGDPVLIDISASITTNNMTNRMIREGRRFEHDWLMEPDGTPTSDPEALKRGGTLMPTGGLDHGQKGYGLALWAEALTQGLAGFGRADAPQGNVAAVTVQVWDPEAFGGRDAFIRQTGWLARACRSNPPRPGVARVRLPGEAAANNRRESERLGVALHDGILASLEDRARSAGVALPDPA